MCCPLRPRRGPEKWRPWPGGVSAVVARAYAVAEDDLRLACHLAEWAFLADRHDHAAQDCCAELFARRQRTEASMMVKAALFTPSRWVKAARGESTGSATADEPAQ
ncbi:MAG: alkyl sulfatase dimerization domain-containing protein [Mycobacteriaceae bacterium]